MGVFTVCTFGIHASIASAGLRKITRHCRAVSIPITINETSLMTAPTQRTYQRVQLSQAAGQLTVSRSRFLNNRCNPFFSTNWSYVARYGSIEASCTDSRLQALL